mgnify:CR=1 FL=1
MPVEVAILSAVLSAKSEEDSYGYAIARRMQADAGSNGLTSHGTLYKALDRLVKGGLLSSRWEDAEVAANEERPRRRLYRVTAAGESAYTEAERVLPRGSVVEGFQPT